jgi:hypothetical protein
MKEDDDDDDNEDDDDDDKDLFLAQNVHIGPGAHPGKYTMSTRFISRG